jgi:hypothetical protein
MARVSSYTPGDAPAGCAWSPEARIVSSEADGFEFDDRRASPPGKILPFAPPRSVPDWLVGPADGLDAASDPNDDTTDEAPPETLPQPVLRRPGAPAPLPPLALVPGDEPGAAGDEPAKAAETEVVPAPARSRRSAPSGIWAPVASSVPALRLALPDDPGPVEEEPFASPAARPRGLPGGEEDLPRAAPPPLAALREPWWVIALDNLRTSRPVQIGAAVALAALVLMVSWLWPRGVGTIALSELRSSPSRFDGRAVVVRGRVGDDVFAVGSGWAFYLVQGRDTIVVFTRTQAPKPHDVVTVKGQVSTGFLDGVPRQALFEDAAPTR